MKFVHLNFFIRKPELTQFMYNGFPTNNLYMVVHRFAWDFKVTEFLGFLSRNGRRQGYFVDCVEPLSPLRKNGEGAICF